LTAVKVREGEKFYRREKTVYHWLDIEEITSIRGATVPMMYSFDDQLWTLKLSLVKPPYVLDFAGAYLHQPPDFSAEIMEQWEEEKKEWF